MGPAATPSREEDFTFWFYGFSLVLERRYSFLGKKTKRDGLGLAHFCSVRFGQVVRSFFSKLALGVARVVAASDVVSCDDMGGPRAACPPGSLRSSQTPAFLDLGFFTWPGGSLIEP